MKRLLTLILITLLAAAPLTNAMEGSAAARNRDQRNTLVGASLVLLGIFAYKISSYIATSEYDQNRKALQLLEQILTYPEEVYDIPALYNKFVKPNLTLLPDNHKLTIEMLFDENRFGKISEFITNTCYEELKLATQKNTNKLSFWQKIKNGLRADCSFTWELIDNWNGFKKYGINFFNNEQYNARIKRRPKKAGSFFNPPVVEPKIIECGICLEEITSDLFTQLSCNHQYCTECLTDLINLTLKEQNTKYLICPSCRAQFTDKDIKNLANDQVDTIEKIRMKEWFATQPNAKQCPTPDCEFMFINDPESKQITQCPSCKQRYCSNCLLNHDAKIISCKDAEQRKHQGEDQASNEQVKKTTKPCPNCGARIEKNEGCLIMSCKCSYHFCWHCFGSLAFHRGQHVTTCNRRQQPNRFL